MDVSGFEEAAAGVTAGLGAVGGFLADLGASPSLLRLVPFLAESALAVAVVAVTFAADDGAALVSGAAAAVLLATAGAGEEAAAPAIAGTGTTELGALTAAAEGAGAGVDEELCWDGWGAGEDATLARAAAMGARAAAWANAGAAVVPSCVFRSSKLLAITVGAVCFLAFFWGVKITSSRSAA